VKDGIDLTGGVRNSGVDDFHTFLISTYQDNRHGDWFTQFDDFFVRKWIDSEPSHGLWGSEVNSSITESITSTTDSTSTAPQTTPTPPPVDMTIIITLGIGGGTILVIAIIVIFLKKQPTGESSSDLQYRW
jgi:hypothetical protein